MIDRICRSFNYPDSPVNPVKLVSGKLTFQNELLYFMLAISENRNRSTYLWTNPDIYPFMKIITLSLTVIIVLQSLALAVSEAPYPLKPYLQKMRVFRSQEEFAGAGINLKRDAVLKDSQGKLWTRGPNGLILQLPNGSKKSYGGRQGLPYADITVIAEERPGLIWLGTTRGAIRFDAGATKRSSAWQYFAGMRWLPDDKVTGIGFDGRGSVWIETAKGFSEIQFKLMRLEDKARLFEERIRARHVRHGLVASSQLRVPGDLTTNQPYSNDNDGLWTAIYIAAEAFRYAVTRDEEARRFARESLNALMRLESITGIPGFPARSFIHRSEPQPADGEWHKTPDGEWLWKGDTSSDEIVGHFYAYSIYYDLVANEKEKRMISEVVDRIMSYIVDNGYYLLDVDGKPTRWGRWSVEYFTTTHDGKRDKGLNSLEILSHLKVAYHITGKEKYRKAYLELIARHNYARNTINQKVTAPGEVNHSDDELAFLSYYPLLLYETDAKLRKIYLESITRSWKIERPEKNPLWNFIYAVGAKTRQFDVEESVETLQRIPLDTISWTVANSHRIDLRFAPTGNRFNRKQALDALAPDERPMLKWNGDPYELDGGGGRSEDDGAFFLLPYWMGRYHKLIDEVGDASR